MELQKETKTTLERKAGTARLSQEMSPRINSTKKKETASAEEISDKIKNLAPYVNDKGYSDNGYIPVTKNKPPTLAETVEYLTQDKGAEVISTQGINGHKLEISNIRVHNTGNLLEAINAGICKETISDDLRNHMQGKYMISAVVDGQSVHKQITEPQYDKYLALDDYQRMRYFNNLFGIKDGNSVVVPDIKYPEFDKNDVSIRNEEAQEKAMDIIKGKDWYKRAEENGRHVKIDNLIVGQNPNNGSYVLKGYENGMPISIILTQKEFDDILSANSNQESREKSAGCSVISSAAYERDYQEMESNGREQEQSVGLGR